MRNVSDKGCRENQNTYFMFSNVFPENRTVYEINVEKYGTDGHVTDDSVHISLVRKV
jgi:hypothetical protein